MKMNASQLDKDELMKFIKSLADAERIKIAGMLGIEPLSTIQIADRLGIKPSEVQRHLEQLIANGLVHKEDNLYHLDTQAVEKHTRHVLAQSRLPAPVYEGDEYEVKTLRAYLSQDGTLKSIPTQHKKLMVILNHLVKDFKPGVQYPESQVNQMLRRYHEDTAALRRYMVDNGLLVREKSVYWKPENPT
jgi:hypothetical protein